MKSPVVKTKRHKGVKITINGRTAWIRRGDGILSETCVSVFRSEPDKPNQVEYFN